jgi:uncharacterized membrane protein
MKNFLSWVLQILVPYVLFLVGFLIVKGARRLSRYEKTFDASFDACILGFGIAAVLLGSAEFKKILDTDATPIIPILVGVACIALFYHLNNSTYRPFTKAWITVIVAGVIFGINTAMVTWLNERTMGKTIFWGVCAWAVPVVIFWFMAKERASNPEHAAIASNERPD